MTQSALGMAYLTHAQLGNHNAGEGSKQLSDLKMYGNRPYISGQAYRHAIREAIQDSAEENVECTPQDACGDLENCLLCDIFGYMNMDLDEPTPEKRVSPLRVTPLVGQYDADVTTDMILQYAPGGSRKKDDDDDGNAEENKIGYRELTDNVYKGAWMLDCDSIGQREREGFDDDNEPGHRYERDLDTVVEDRPERVQILLDGLKNASGLAGQARHMADFMPDVVVATANDTYSQRVTNTLHIEDGELNIPAFESVVEDLTHDGGDVWVAGTHNPTVMDNWDAFFDAAEADENVTVCDSVSDCYDKLAATLD
ncbi:DevR family CRISPR-associated autoregulator [Halorussus lipolyticus]|uniref:DevR family CRISPR-associated autoregulator n=1 Tax=Halorussus lipolyticus TaxID=3034024 RepID=UPI0023E7E031|nr:DevR family CRISPR-associated autoregulator [Halorussus sp. DT80]